MKKSAFQVFSAAARAAKNGYFRLFFTSLARFGRHDPSPSDPEICRFPNIESFAQSYAKLAAFLGRPHLQPPEGEIDFLQRMMEQSTPRPGSLSPEDYFFLMAITSILAPRRVIEIGTLTGFSAAIIAMAVNERHPGDRKCWVDSIDIKAQCAIDQSRPTGFQIEELIPHLAGMVRLHNPYDSKFIRQLAERNESEFAFIDANHSHPWPLLDLLRMARCMRGGAWIVLHDVLLGSVGKELIASDRAPLFQAGFGAEWVFNYWPFRKVSAGNMGAIQIPENKGALVALALRLMSLPFEIEKRKWKTMYRELYQSLDELV